MNAEQRTQDAITITRTILTKALTSPFTLAVMTWGEVEPEVMEDVVDDILRYLEKTSPKKPEEAEE